MNHAMVCYLVGWMLSVEGGILLLPMLTAVIYQEPIAFAYLAVSALCLVFSCLFTRCKPKNTRFYAREGFVTVSLCWIVLALTAVKSYTVLTVSAWKPSFPWTKRIGMRRKR